MKIVESDLTEEGLDIEIPPHLVVVEDDLGMRSYASAETAKDAPAGLTHYADLPSRVSRERLLAVCVSMNDGELEMYFKDSVLPLAVPKDRPALTAYYQSRKKAPYWGPGGVGNNHANIIPKKTAPTSESVKGRQTLTNQERRRRRNEASARARAKRKGLTI